jgi:predicted double-glycine peptidase
MTIPDYVAFCLESHGIPARLESGNIHKLKRYVSNDRPPIVLLRSGNRYWHYVVVIGYNQDKIMIADPGSGQKEELLEEVFMEAWRFSGDMQGNKVEGFDLFRYIVERIAGVSGQTMIVPGKMI